MVRPNIIFSNNKIAHLVRIFTLFRTQINTIKCEITKSHECAGSCSNPVKGLKEWMFTGCTTLSGDNGQAFCRTCDAGIEPAFAAIGESEALIE